MQAKYDRLKQYYRPHPPRAYQQGSRGTTFNLYQKTRDAMVAFELAKYFETSGQNADAAKCIPPRRRDSAASDWKIKAQEAAVRLGGAPGEIRWKRGRHQQGSFALTPPPDSALEPELQFERT